MMTDVISWMTVRAHVKAECPSRSMLRLSDLLLFQTCLAATETPDIPRIDPTRLAYLLFLHFSLFSMEQRFRLKQAQWGASVHSHL